MILDQDEILLNEIKHGNYLPIRQEDLGGFMTIPFMFIGLKFYFKHNEYFSLLFIAPVLLMCIRLLVRWLKILYVSYYMTDKRLIIYNKKQKKIEYSFYYSDFPKMTLRENAYNNGFIIIGAADVHYKFSDTRGVELSDFEVVIDNIKNVRVVYNLILEKIKIAQENENNTK